MTSVRLDAVRRDLFHCAAKGQVFTHDKPLKASVLRDVLVGPLPEDVPSRPSRIVIGNTRIDGDLNLHGLAVEPRLSLYNCHVEGIVSLLDATIPGLMMDTGSVQWLDGANVEIAMELWLKHVTFAAGIDLTDARVGGSVHLEGSRFLAEQRPVQEDSLPAGCPLRLNRVTIGGTLNTARIEVDGMMDLADARVGGSIELEGACIREPLAPVYSRPPTAINAPCLRVEGSVTADRRRLRTQRVVVIADTRGARPRSKDAEIMYSTVVPGPEVDEGVEALGATAASAMTAADTAVPSQAVPDAAETAFSAVGRLYFANARIGGDFDLTGATLTMPVGGRDGEEAPQASADPVGPTLDAQRDFNAVLVLDRCDVRGNVELDDGFVATGLIRMTNAHVAGDLRLNGSRVSGQNHTPDRRVYSLIADGVSIGGQLDASAAHITGEIRLRDAHVRHNLFFRSARLTTPNGNALNVERAQIGGTVDCTALTAQGSLRMLDIVCGPVFLNGAKLTDPCTAANSSPFDAAGLFDPALNLIGARITGFVQASLDDTGETEDGKPRTFTADGAVSLRQAQVTRSVRLSKAVVSATGTVAFQASGLTAADLDLEEARITGGLAFANAEISGCVTLTKAELDVAGHHCAGPEASQDPSAPRPTSLDGSSASIGADLLMSGIHAAHAVRLRRATVFRRLDLSDAKLCDGAFALDLAGLHAPDIQLTPENVNGRVDLSNVITIIWVDNDSLWKTREVDIWGLEFAILIDGDKGVKGRDRLTRQLRRLDQAHILLPQEHGTGIVPPKDQIQQPYQQLARHYRERGLDREARRVLNRMSRREWRNRHQDETNPLLKAGIWLGRWVYDITLGFGYRLTGAFGVLLGVWLLGGLLFAGFAKETTATPTDPPSGAAAATNSSCVLPDGADPVPSQPGYCGTYNAYLYSLDTLLPVINLGQADSWHFRNAVPQAIGAVLQVIGWGLASAVALSALSLVGGDGGNAEPAQPRWSGR